MQDLSSALKGVLLGLSLLVVFESRKILCFAERDIRDDGCELAEDGKFRLGFALLLAALFRERRKQKKDELSNSLSRC